MGSGRLAQSQETIWSWPRDETPWPNSFSSLLPGKCTHGNSENKTHPACARIQDPEQARRRNAPRRARGLSGIALCPAQDPSLRRGLAAATAWGALVRGWPGTGSLEKALITAAHGRLSTGRYQHPLVRRTNERENADRSARVQYRANLSLCSGQGRLQDRHQR